MSSKNRTRGTATRNIRFPNHIVEQIDITLEHKGSSSFSAWVIEACRKGLATDATYPRPASTTNDEK